MQHPVFAANSRPSPLISHTLIKQYVINEQESTLPSKPCGNILVNVLRNTHRCDSAVSVAKSWEIRSSNKTLITIGYGSCLQGLAGLMVSFAVCTTFCSQKHSIIKNNREKVSQNSYTVYGRYRGGKKSSGNCDKNVQYIPREKTSRWQRGFVSTEILFPGGRVNSEGYLRLWERSMLRIFVAEPGAPGAESLQCGGAAFLHRVVVVPAARSNKRRGREEG